MAAWNVENIALRMTQSYGCTGSSGNVACLAPSDRQHVFHCLGTAGLQQLLTIGKDSANNKGTFVGKDNLPASCIHVKHTMEHEAKVMGGSPALLSQITCSNAKQVFIRYTRLVYI